jgi:DNA-binding NtrC family response regulator
MRRDQTILLVEDENPVLIAGRALLERLDYAVMTATDGSEALHIYQRHQNEIDLVLTDVRMPEMGGHELYVALKRINPAVKALLMSAHHVEDRMTDPQMAGLKGVLQKPFSLDSLGRAVRRALEEEAV